MGYDQTELYFLERDLSRCFGKEEGARLYARASKLYRELSVTTDFKGSMTLERQMDGLILPVIALYKTLIQEGYRKDNALGVLRTITSRAAEESGQRLKAQNRKITPYRAFRRNIRNFIEYRFPEAGGWDVSKPVLEKNDICFYIEECVYWRITKRFGCLELCGVFCDYERIAFAGLKPYTVFSCSERIADGCKNCVFHFGKGTKEKEEK